MSSITLQWQSFIEKVNQSDLVIKYAAAQDNYYLYTYQNDLEYVCVLPQDSAEDFEQNYKSAATALI